MKLLRYMLLAFVGVSLIALAVVAIVLPRVTSSPEVQTKIKTAARDAMGREVAFEDLSFGLLPPKLIVKSVLIAGETPEAEPLLEATEIDLQVALLPLLSRAVVVNSLVIDGATIHLVRDKKGLRLPGKPKAAAEKPSDTAKSGAPMGLALAVRNLQFKNMTLIFDDRSLAKPVIWTIRDLGLQASLGMKDKDWFVDFALKAFLNDGSIAGKGRAVSSGEINVNLGLSAIDLAPFSAYLARGQKLAGIARGKLAVVGEKTGIEQITLDLTVEKSAFQFNDVGLKGVLTVRTDLKGVPPKGEGTVFVDATKAAVSYANSFRKPSGTDAKLEGRLVPSEAGTFAFAIDNLKLHTLKLQGDVHKAQRVRVDLKPFHFDLRGWDELIPALAAHPVSGAIDSDGLKIATAPLDLQGRFRLNDLVYALNSSGKATLRGDINAKGDAIRFDPLDIVMAEQVIKAAGGVTGLGKKTAYRLELSGKALDMEKLFGELSTSDSPISGPMDFQGDIRGEVGKRPPTEAILGQIKFNAGPGKIKGVSILEGVFSGFSTVAETAVLLGKAKGKDFEKYYDEEFQDASGTLDIANGFAKTDDLKLVYANYTANLRGTIVLKDQSLDMTGHLTLDEEIDRKLAKADASYTGRKRTIKITRITGTLQDPKFQLSTVDVLAFAANYKLGKDRKKLTGKIDEKLGAGAGDEVISVLEGILGSRESTSQEPSGESPKEQPKEPSKEQPKSGAQ